MQQAILSLGKSSRTDDEHIEEEEEEATAKKTDDYYDETKRNKWIVVSASCSFRIPMCCMHMHGTARHICDESWWIRNIFTITAGIEIFPYILSGRFDYILIRDTQVHMWSGRMGARGLLCECVCERAIYGNIQSADI